MNIEQLLRDYRTNQSKLKLFEIEKQKLEKELQKIPDEVKYISSQTLSLTPYSVTNKFKSDTESSGIKSAVIHEQQKEKLAQVVFEIEDLKREIKITESLLEALDDTERFVIEKIYISGFRWYYVPTEYYKIFNQSISKDTLKRKQKAAIEKMVIILKSVA